MKKSKIITVLGLATIALSLSACSNNASSNNSSNQATSTSKKTPRDAELVKSKNNAETVIKALKDDKVNFTSYLTYLPDTENSDYAGDPITKALPASKPTVTVSEFAKKHHFNKYQIDILNGLLGGDGKPTLIFDPSKDDTDANGKTIPNGTFDRYDNISSAYFIISHPKLETTKNESGSIKYYEVDAEVTTCAQTKDGYKLDRTKPMSGSSLTDKIHY